MPANNAPNAALQAAQIAEVNGVAGHIRIASKATGVSFDYLMAQAGTESSFETDAKSRLSSAAGLFQFTEGTWLQLIKLHGAAYSLPDEADAIQRSGKGDYRVANPEKRQKILALRRDPALSSLIAGEYARDNKRWLEKSLGHRVGSTELYLAHFLGPAGAVKMLQARAEDPEQAAAGVAPEAAVTNQAMFYERDRTPQSVAALYEHVRHVMENPAHPPHRQTPPADLALAALRYGSLPWALSTSDAMTDSDALLSTVRVSIQAYTDGARSADRISAPMPPMAPLAPVEAAEPMAHWLKRLFG
jgi:hypothetical protein